MAIAWLVKAAMRYHRCAIPVASLSSTAVLFPFALDLSLAWDISLSAMLELRTEGGYQQVVALVTGFDAACI